MGFSRGEVTVVSNGVDSTRFTPEVDCSAMRARFGIAEDDCVLLCPRRLEKKNGVIYWIRAIPTIVERVTGRKLRFVFAGDYPDDDAYSARAEVLEALAGLDLGEQIIFTGAIPPSEMPQMMAAADIAVLPSLMEATSIAGLEAMASGKPLIGTDVGGIPEILADGKTGLLVPPADPAALAEAAIDLILDAEKCSRLGVAARERVMAEFSWDVAAEPTLDVYKRLLSRQAMESL